MTITRDKLKKMYEENIVEIKNGHIQNYVDQIKESIIRLNNKGEKKYTKYFYKENEDIMKEVSRRLYEIFIDCEVTCYTSNESEYRIFIDWT